MHHNGLLYKSNTKRELIVRECGVIFHRYPQVKLNTKRLIKFIFFRRGIHRNAARLQCFIICYYTPSNTKHPSTPLRGVRITQFSLRSTNKYRRRPANFKQERITY